MGEAGRDRRPVGRPVEIRGGEIRLGQLLKLAGAVANGSDARPLLEGGGVEVNGSVETRRGRRCIPGDRIALGDEVLVLVAAAEHPPRFELGDPGPMRDRLVAAVRRGDGLGTPSA